MMSQAGIVVKNTYFRVTNQGPKAGSASEASRWVSVCLLNKHNNNLYHQVAMTNDKINDNMYNKSIYDKSWHKTGIQ